MKLHYLPTPPDQFEKEKIRLRGRITFFVMAALFAVLIGRLWFLQVAQGADFREASELNRIRRERLFAPRGEILDRKGELLAGTRPKFVVSVTPTQFNPEGPEGRRLAECLGIPLDELKLLAKAVGPEYRRVRVAVDIPWEVLTRLEEMRPWLPGVSVQLEDLRYYPQGKLAAHLLGYIGPITETMLAEHRDVYAPDSRVGKTGIEQFYEDYLRGKDGGLVLEVDATGRRKRLLRQEQPERGADLMLTINAKIQRAAEEALNGRVGAAVAIDPRNGEILALVSRPAFDPNLFAKGIGSADWRAILSDENKPMMNRAITSVYPPASTFKPITSLAGLSVGKIPDGHTITCTGVNPMGRLSFRCWKAHGPGINHRHAIAQSCNSFYFNVARSMGPKPIADMAKSFGLGQLTGIDIGGERRGTVPSPAWKRENVKNDPKWHPGETLNISIGQGATQTTCLQMAMVTGGIFMRGKVFQPHLVKEIRTSERTIITEPKLIHEVSIPTKYFDIVIDGMIHAVSAGTGRSAALPDIVVAGKTGSAQNPTKKAHGWFVAAAPAQNPEIAIAVIVEQGLHGSSSAAPVAREILKAYFGITSDVQAPRVHGD